MEAAGNSRRIRNRLPDLPADHVDDAEESFLPSMHADPVRARRTSSRVEPLAPVRKRPAVIQSRRVTRPVMPSLHDILFLAFPCALMAVSIAVVWLLGRLTPFGPAVWAVGVYIPTVLLAWVSGTSVRLPWQRAALINLATIDRKSVV